MAPRSRSAASRHSFEAPAVSSPWYCQSAQAGPACQQLPASTWFRAGACRLRLSAAPQQRGAQLPPEPPSANPPPPPTSQLALACRKRACVRGISGCSQAAVTTLALRQTAHLRSVQSQSCWCTKCTACEPAGTPHQTRWAHMRHSDRPCRPGTGVTMLDRIVAPLAARADEYSRMVPPLPLTPLPMTSSHGLPSPPRWMTKGSLKPVSCMPGGGTAMAGSCSFSQVRSCASPAHASAP